MQPQETGARLTCLARAEKLSRRDTRVALSSLLFNTELRGAKYPICVIVDWTSCTICASPRSYHHSLPWRAVSLVG